MKPVYIGITGTKGKTTVAYFIRDILTAAGYRTGLVSTNEVCTGLHTYPARNTTPPKEQLQSYLKEMEEARCQVIIIEVSSLGLKEGRVEGIWFDYGLFTNMGVDHIGGKEHKDFAEYFYWKKQLFAQCGIGIFNQADPYFPAIAEYASCEIRDYCHEDELAKEVTMIGAFNKDNARAAITVVRDLGVSDEIIRSVLPRLTVKGRMERLVPEAGYQIIIDYAHNGMALEQALQALRPEVEGRIICLFGCGGNRSQERRIGMGKASGRYADLSIVTSDNPRWEEPMEIIADILVGMKQTEGEYKVIENRREAIHYGLSVLQPEDVLFLAGKGHEIYQEIRGKRYPMDEREIVREYFE